MVEAENENDPQADEIFTVPMTVYDKLGNNYKINLEFFKIEAGEEGTTWGWRIPEGTRYAVEVVEGEDTLEFGTDGILATDPPTATIRFTPDEEMGTDGFDVTIDFSKLTMFAADNSVKPKSIDGYSSGNLVTFSVGPDGILTGIYDNGQQQSLGLIAITSFENRQACRRSVTIFTYRRRTQAITSRQSLVQTVRERLIPAPWKCRTWTFRRSSRK
jgi:flagellar hook protein FlgE